MITVRRRTNQAQRATSPSLAATRSCGVLLALALGVFTAGCQDTIAPTDAPKPQFAQGDGGVWTVTTLDDEAPVDGCTVGECTLREAIAAAADGGTIGFAPDVTGVIQLYQGDLVIGKSLRIMGPGSGSLAIDAMGGGRVFFITEANAEPAEVEIQGLTLQSGFALTGGAIYSNETLTLEDVRVAHNVATGSGGGIYSAGRLSLRNSTVASNSAANGGGIADDGVSETSVVGSTVSGNAATNVGGGISRASGRLTLVNSTISGNIGEVAGAGIYTFNSVLVALGSTILDGVHFAADAAGMAAFENTLLGGDCSSAGGAVMQSLGYNLLFDCAFDASHPTDLTFLGDLSEVVDLVLADNGGPTATHALLAAGPAVDAGNCPSFNVDQRGFPRRVDYPGVTNRDDGCDIGAFELQLPLPADLMVSQAVDKTSVKQGELLTYSIRVQNLGPGTAPNVVMNDVLSSGVTFVEARGNRGSFTAPNKGETGTVTWYLGDMLNQANEVAEIVVTVLVKGKTTITSSASVTGDVADPNPANNTASITVSVASGGAASGGKKK